MSREEFEIFENFGKINVLVEIDFKKAEIWVE